MAAALPPSLPVLVHDAVLVPGADLTLRLLPSVHGPLLRAAAGSGGRFGVCLGEEQAIAGIGVEARIDDFSTTPDGALTVRVHGCRRFRVRQTLVRDGVMTAITDWCEPDGDEPLRPEHALLAIVLERILEQAGAGATAAQLDDSAWIGWRLVEWLPLSATQRQALLQEDDLFVRLDRLLERLS